MWIGLSEFRRLYRLSHAQARRFLAEPDFPGTWISPNRVKIAAERLDPWLATWAQRQKAAGQTAAREE